MNKTLKNVLIVLAVGFVAYAVYAMWQAFKAGEKTVAGLLLSPFSALSAVWSAVSGSVGGWFGASVPTVQKSTGNTAGDAAVNSWIDSAGKPLPPSDAAVIPTVFNTDANGNAIVWSF
jgi:hypothetical protein